MGHVYGYTLEPMDGGTMVTSYYDWSAIDQAWKDGGVFPVIPEGALRATLGILARTVAPGGFAAVEGAWPGYALLPTGLPDPVSPRLNLAPLNPRTSSPGQNDAVLGAILGVEDRLVPDIRGQRAARAELVALLGQHRVGKGVHVARRSCRRCRRGS